MHTTLSALSLSRLAKRALSPALLFALAAPALTAQSFDVLLSTSADAQLGSPAGDWPVGDQELFTHGADGVSRVTWPSETLAALAGDPGGTGLHHVFGDVDAVHDQGLIPADRGLYVSLVTNEGGFLDGDVLRVQPSGFVVFLAEAAFMDATGATDGNVDVDAFHREPDGRVIFSFAEDEASSLLSGDDPGVIADGDVLTWMPSLGTADILYTESAIDGLVSQALGVATVTGEVKGLARDPVSNALLFTVQSPSAHDASLFSDEGGGQLVPGHTEADMGFGGAAELDALSVSPTSWPSLTVSDGLPAAGDTLHADLRGTNPGDAYVLLMALDIGPVLIPAFGWGGLMLTDDLLLQTSVVLTPSRTVIADGLGEARFSATIPAGIPPVDVHLQYLSLVSPHTGTNPVVVEVGQ